MKNFDIKKIGIVLAILVVVVLAIFLLGKSIKGNVSDESLKQYEEKVTSYYLGLSGGLNTIYGGYEALYQADETKLEDLSNRQLLKTAINYIISEGKVNGVDIGTLTMLYKDKYPEIDKSGIYDAKEIRNAINILFGIEDFANPTIYADGTSLTNYTYLAEEDLYLVNGDYTTSQKDENLMIDFSVIETKAKKDKIITTVAIAYVQKNEDKKTYASDMSGEKIVAEDCLEFPTNKIDEFSKYEFTLTKSKDGKDYIFESVKKVK